MTITKIIAYIMIGLGIICMLVGGLFALTGDTTMFEVAFGGVFSIVAGILVLELYRISVFLDAMESRQDRMEDILISMNKRQEKGNT